MKDALGDLSIIEEQANKQTNFTANLCAHGLTLAHGFTLVLQSRPLMSKANENNTILFRTKRPTAEHASITN